MQTTFEVKLNYGLARCAIEKAAAQGRNIGNSTGVPGLLRQGLRAYLSQNGYSVADLDETQEPPAEAATTQVSTIGRSIESAPLPDARKSQESGGAA